MPMGKYLNKLDKLMSWSLISLNLQYNNHSLLSYNHSQVIHSLLWKMGSKLWKLLFLDSLSAFTSRNYKISLFCFTSQYSQNDNFTRITFVGRLSGGWKYSHANKSNTVTAKKNVKQKFSCCNVI